MFRTGEPLFQSGYRLQPSRDILSPILFCSFAIALSVVFLLEGMGLPVFSSLTSVGTKLDEWFPKG